MSLTFEWSEIWTNIVADFIFFVITIPIVIGFLPSYTEGLLRKRNKRHLILKISSLIFELCEFLSYTQYRDKTILNAEHLVITTKKRPIKHFRHVALCSVNVFKTNFIDPQILIIIHKTHEKLAPDKSYALLTEEFKRLKELRAEIERILSAHALYLEENVILKISDLCFQIRKLELDFKNNLDYQELSKALNKPGYSSFGQGQLPKIYQSIFGLIRDLLIKEYFDYTITYPHED